QGRGAHAKQVVADPGQLGDDRPDVLAPRGQLDPHELLDRVVPGDLVADRGNVIHPIDDRHVLVVIEVLPELLDPGVQVADVRDRLDDRLAVEGEDEAQGSVRGRVLRAEVERVEELLLGSLLIDGERYGRGKGHSGFFLVSANRTSRSHRTYMSYPPSLILLN